MRNDLPAPDPSADHELNVRWLISYADFMMQLLIVFVLLFSVSSFDPQKAAAVAAGWIESRGLEGKIPTTTQPTIGDYVPLIRSRIPPQGKTIPFGSDVRGRRITLTFAEPGVFVSFLHPVPFSVGSFEITPDFKGDLELVRQELRNTINSIDVIGHTSGEPNDVVNGSGWSLSALRAQAVADFLIGDPKNFVIDPHRISITARGPFDPPKQGENARRVEILVRRLN